MKNILFHSGKHKTLPSIALLIQRLAFGGMMLRHGYPKLINFLELANHFSDPLGVGKSLSLGLVVFAEFGCSILVILGLGTRWAVVPLIINMSVIIAIIQMHQPFAKKELALLYLAAFLVLLLFGAGKYSLDKLISKK